jgi:acyl dehydratase
MYTAFIGKRSNKVVNTVEKGAVRKFAEAIGDPHPLYMDEEYAQKTRYKKNIAPPTFPRVFDYGTIEGLRLPPSGLIHGEQVYEYKRPLLLGEEVSCYSQVDNYFEKAGNTGTLSFLVIKSIGEDQAGQIIFSSKQVIIITEAIRKEMGK